MYIYDVQYTKKALIQFADSAGPDQPVHLCRLTLAFIVCYIHSGSAILLLQIQLCGHMMAKAVARKVHDHSKNIFTVFLYTSIVSLG